ncbi:MAG: flgA [Rhodocyclaceae bacterium]|nr:flgA [Rhodocyclaceae bacterium]
MPAALAAESLETRVGQAARQFLLEQAARAGLAKPVVDLTVAAGSRTVPNCRPPVAVEPVDTRYPGRMRFAALCPAEQGGRQEFVVRATLSAEVLVTATAVPAGKPLVPTDLALERRDISTTPDALSNVETVAGLASRRSLRAGQILARQWLVEPVLVRRGEAVRIVARSGPIEVSSAGEALEAGRREDTVRVRNSASGKVIRARITASGTVEPADMPVSMPSQSPD